MNKIVCLDLDGVSLVEHDRFSTRLIEKQGPQIEAAVNEYFSKSFGLVLTGEASLADTITPYLTRFNWDGDAPSLLRFWFDGEKTPRQPVLDLAHAIKDSGTPTYVVTDNPAERTTELWSEFLSEFFTGKYVSGETGFKKNNPAIWEKVSKDTATSFDNIFFADDDPENVAVAKTAGVQAVLYLNPAQLGNDIELFLQHS